MNNCFVGFLVAVLCIAQCNGQNTVRPVSPDGTAASVSMRPKTAEETAKDADYRYEAGDITFRYPSDLKRGDAKATAEKGHIALYGNDPQTDADHIESERCMHILLMVEIPENNSSSTLTLGEVAKPEAQIRRSSAGSIMFAEADRKCLSKMSANDALGNMAHTAQLIPGMNPIDRQIWYELDKHKVHFSAASGRIVSRRADGTKEEAAEESAVATFSVKSKGRFLMWMITANDLPLFNRLLKSTVQFGNGPILPLLPFDIGDGPPVKPIP